MVYFKQFIAFYLLCSSSYPGELKDASMLQTTLLVIKVDNLAHMSKFYWSLFSFVPSNEFERPSEQV